MLNPTDKLIRRWILKQANHLGVVYLGFFLPLMEQKKLLKKFGKKHPNIHTDHMTIWFFQDGGDPQLEKLPLGKSFPLKIIGYVEDDKAQVALVQLPSKFKLRSGRIAHITLTAASGVPPKYSKELIAHSSRKDIQKGLPTVTGKLGWFDGEKVRYDQPNT